MDNLCKACGGPFSQREDGKRMYRYKITNVVCPDSIKLLWPHLDTCDGHICNKCRCYAHTKCRPLVAFGKNNTHRVRYTYIGSSTKSESSSNNNPPRDSSPSLKRSRPIMPVGTTPRLPQDVHVVEQHGKVYIFPKVVSQPNDSLTRQHVASHEQRPEGGRCLHCLQLITKGASGWRKVSLSSLNLFNMHKVSLQQCYGVSDGFLCVACALSKFSSKELSASKVLTIPFTDPPVCLQCCKVLQTDNDALSSVSLSSLPKSCGVEFLLNCMQLCNTTCGVVCQNCAISHLNQQKSKPSETSTKIAQKDEVYENTKPKVAIQSTNRTLSGIGKKIASMTLNSGKVVYGSSKRAVILHELKRLMSTCVSCESCNCKEPDEKRKSLAEKKDKKGIARKKGDKTKLEFYRYANSFSLVRDPVTKSYSRRAYKQCIYLLAKQPAALKHMKRVVRKAVKKEAKKYMNAPNHLLSRRVTNELLAKFSWSDIIKEAKTHMPTLVKILSELIPPGSVMYKRIVIQEKFDETGNMQAEAKFGFILSLIANCLHPKLCLVQILLSLEAWKHGVPQELSKRFNQLGLLYLDHRKGLYIARRLKKDAISSIEDWKLDVTRAPSQEMTSAPSQEVTSAPSQEMTSAPSQETQEMQQNDIDGSLVQLRVRKKQKIDTEKVHKIPLLPDMKQGLGFCLFWREISVETNLDIYHRGKPSKAVVLLAIRNRANFKNLSSTQPATQAKDVPLEALLPNHSDYSEMQRRMERVVLKILIKHLRTTEDDEEKIHVPETQPNQHRFSVHMRQQSEIVHLGIVKEDPSTHKGYWAILQELSKYVPVNEQGQPMPTPLYADSQTVKKMLTMNQDADETNSKVQGFVPVIHEFGRIRTYFRELLNNMYTNESNLDKGTIYYLMEHSSFKSVWNSEDPDKTKAFVQLMTEVHVVLLAKHLAGERRRDVETPLDKSTDDRKSLKALAASVVRFLWCEDHKSQVNEVIIAARENLQTRNLQENPDGKVEIPMETEDDGCDCGENNTDGMIRCAYLHCPGEKFHFDCVGITANTVPDGEWYCSDECEALAIDNDTYTFCHCHEYGEDLTMIQCELAGRCTGHQWYHLSCLGMKGNMPNTWFCSDACKASRRAPTQDYMQNYAKELTWQGLKYMTRMDAIHEGDGEAMLSYWKLDVLHFWNTNNWDNLIPAHSFLTGVHWTHSPRLANELIWNRVANVTGLPGDNVGMDEVDDLVNRDFRDMAVRSNLTDTQAYRHNQCGGRIAALSHLFFCKERSDLLGRRQTSKNHKEVAKLIAECEELRLFDHVPDRHHLAFPEFKADHSLRDPQLLADDLKNLGQLLDREKE